VISAAVPKDNAAARPARDTLHTLPERPCPNCTAATEAILVQASSTTDALYFLCRNCGHVCVARRSDPDAPPITIVAGRIR
jgi:hypothetical protein